MDAGIVTPLSKKLLNQMVRRNLNGQKLAKISQVSDSEISRILAGKSRPGLENAFRLAKALGVSLDYLADDTLETDPAQAIDPLSVEEREILDLAQAIGSSRVRHLLESIRFIGYEVAMRRLMNVTPIVVEVDDGRAAPSTTSVATGPAGRANSA